MQAAPVAPALASAILRLQPPALESGQWRAVIGRNGQVIYLGRFATPQAAHAAYVAAARKLFGKFARTE